MSYYEPKKVFVKTENGAYTEITFQQFKTLRETDKSFSERKFIRVYVDTLVEFDKEGFKIMDSDRRHLRYLRKNDAKHKLTYYGCVYEADTEELNPALQAEKNELIKEPLTDFNEELFGMIVKQITVLTSTSLCFELIGGIKLREIIPEQTR